MTTFDAFIETGEEGIVMGHIPSLPGCHARGRVSEEAVHDLAGAVRECHSWLVDHGEPAPASEEISICVAEVIKGARPHHPGNRSARFRADAISMTLKEMGSSHPSRAEYTRADLLALVTELSDNAWTGARSGDHIDPLHPSPQRQFRRMVSFSQWSARPPSPAFGAFQAKSSPA